MNFFDKILTNFWFIFRYLARQNESMRFENEVCSFYFDLESMSPDAEIPLFNAKYHFTLEEVVNLPEFLIYFPLLIE